MEFTIKRLDKHDKGYLQLSEFIAAVSPPSTIEGKKNEANYSI